MEEKYPLKYPQQLSTPSITEQKNKDQLIISPLIQEIYDEYEKYEYTPIIHSVTVKSVSGYPIPNLLVNNEENMFFTIPLFGIISLELHERVCLLCNTVIPSTNKQPYCEQCYTIERFYGQLCRFDGPGTPFGTKCNINNPPCVSLQGPKGCFNKHYLYIASLGDQLKVGISSEKRSHGIYTRLLEQGIRKAIVIRSFPNLHEAMNAEKIVQEQLSISPRITDYAKARAILIEDEPIHKQEHWIHKEIRKIFPDKKIIGLNLFERPSFLENKEVIMQQIIPPKIEGEILYSLGKYVLMASPTTNPEEVDTLVMLNTEKLRGYVLNIPEIT